MEDYTSFILCFLFISCTFYQQFVKQKPQFQLNPSLLSAAPVHIEGRMMTSAPLAVCHCFSLLSAAFISLSFKCQRFSVLSEHMQESPTCPVGSSISG